MGSARYGPWVSVVRSRLGPTPVVAVVVLAFLLSACGGGSSGKGAAGSSGNSGNSGSSGNSGNSGAASPTTTAPAQDPANKPAGPTGTGYAPTGPLVADTGFRPATNGFPFDNYGDQLDDGSSVAELTPAGMQKLFGTSVCSDPKCDLTPPAQAWMDNQNSSMSGGHCYGFSVLSLLMWKGQVQPSAYGAASVPALTDEHNAPLQSEIAYAFSFQSLDAVNNTLIRGDPNSILAQLEKLLVPGAPDTYGLGIYNGSDGHEITPFAVEDNGGGMYHVLVYDNNWPGETRAMTFDTNANTWSYLAATNPNEPDATYSGNATTPNIDIDPTGPGVGVQPFPYAGTVGTGSSGSTGSSGGKKGGAPVLDDIYLDGGSDVSHAHLLIKNPDGQEIGFVNGKMVNTIPGARIEISRTNENWAEAPEPDYLVPDGVRYTITDDGSGLAAADPDEDFGIIAPGYAVEVDHINAFPKQKQTLTINPDGSMMSFTSTDRQRPELNLGVSDTTADYTFTVKGDQVAAGGTVRLDLPVDGDTMTISTEGAGTSQVSLALDREDDHGQQYFVHNGISLSKGDTGALRFGGWQDGQPMPLTITHDGQSHTEQLQDQGPPPGSTGTGNS